MDCKNINLKRGTTGSQVTELQNKLKNLKYYTGKVDGSYGQYTENAVKYFQKKYNLKQDGIFGPITCKKLNETLGINTTTNTGATTGVYISTGHYSGTGCNKKGQCTCYHCAPHTIRQDIAKKDIDFTEQVIGGWAGTTSHGTGHDGINTALRMLQIKTGKKITGEWKNFSDLGSTVKERFKKLGEIIEKPNKQVIVHSMYKKQWGHYEFIKEVNMNNQTCTMFNSLGSRCGGTSYCGFTETRSFSTFASWISLISQKSICIITIED